MITRKKDFSLKIKFEKIKKRTIPASIFLGIAAFIVILIIIGFLVFVNIKIKQEYSELMFLLNTKM
jgi:hypothetical protein